MTANPTTTPLSTVVLVVIDRSGDRSEIAWESDVSLMEALRDHDQPVLASCGGTASCATCHVFLPGEVVDRLGDRSSDEQELLEEAEAYDPRLSRLSCQVGWDASLAGMTVILAPEDE